MSGELTDNGDIAQVDLLGRCDLRNKLAVVDGVSGSMTHVTG